MGAPASLAIPAAIVIAGAMIATGLFLGLRAQSPPPAPVPPVIATPPVATPAPSPPPAPPVADREAVTRQAAEALAYQRPRLVTRCLAAGSPTPPAEFLLNVTFDPAGEQLARGAHVKDGTATPELYACVSEHLAPLKIPPPGATIMVEVPLRLP